jgi:hypothetical protein
MSEKTEINWNEFDDSKLPGSGNIDWNTMPEGMYRSRVSAYEKNDKGNIVLKNAISQGDFEGAQRDVTLGTDLTKRTNHINWFHAMLSAGVEREKAIAVGKKLQKGDTTCEKIAAGLVGKECHLYYKPKSGSEQYNEQRLIGPKAAALKQEEINKRGAVPAGATATSTVQTAAPASRANGAAKPVTPQPVADTNAAEEALDL